MIQYSIIFTSNDDGINDGFYAVGENVLEFQMVIFNRWGEVLKTLHHIDETWDGTHNGRQCGEGVYYYIANFREVGRDSNPIAKEIRGAVMLVVGGR